MQQITNLTSSVKQQMQLILENNETADFYLHYNGRMEAWFFSFSYGNITVNNLKVCLHPNILRAFKNIIPFGISFASTNIVEPFQVTSFSSGACGMYLLDKEEVAEVEENIFNYVPDKTNKYIGDFNTLDALKEYDGILNDGDYAFVISDSKYLKYSWTGYEWVRS